MTRALIKIALVCIVGALSFGDVARATPTNAGFNEGNQRYAAGKFAEAITSYEGQVRRGEYTANLFYNLADAYYRQGNRGRAILNYQRALILDPGHVEAAANLAFVRGSKPTTALTSTGWVVPTLPWATAAAFWLAVAGLVIALAGRWARVAGFALLSIGLLAGVTGAVAIRLEDDGARDPSRAVIVTENAPALYAPADNSKVVTTLTTGAEVRVLSDQGAWVYALLNDGTRAWVAASQIEPIVPRS